MKIDKKYLILLTIAGLVVSIDQATKLYILSHFSHGESFLVIENFFNFTYVRNPGAAFGFLSTSHETFRHIFFLSITPIALIFILYMLKETPSSDRIQVIALSSIFGGAIGNYIDRLRFGYVVDFLDFHIHNKYVWPAFNIADSAIVCGSLILLLIMFRKDRSLEAA